MRVYFVMQIIHRAVKSYNLLSLPADKYINGQRRDNSVTTSLSNKNFYLYTYSTLYHHAGVYLLDTNVIQSRFVVVVVCIYAWLAATRIKIYAKRYITDERHFSS